MEFRTRKPRDPIALRSTGHEYHRGYVVLELLCGCCHGKGPVDRDSINFLAHG